MDSTYLSTLKENLSFIKRLTTSKAYTAMHLSDVEVTKIFEFLQNSIAMTIPNPFFYTSKRHYMLLTSQNFIYLSLLLWLAVANRLSLSNCWGSIGIKQLISERCVWMLITYVSINPKETEESGIPSLPLILWQTYLLLFLVLDWLLLGNIILDGCNKILLLI